MLKIDFQPVWIMLNSFNKDVKDNFFNLFDYLAVILVPLLILFAWIGFSGDVFKVFKVYHYGEIEHLTVSEKKKELIQGFRGSYTDYKIIFEEYEGYELPIWWQFQFDEFEKKQIVPVYIYNKTPEYIIYTGTQKAGFVRLLWHGTSILQFTVTSIIFLLLVLFVGYKYLEILSQSYSELKLKTENLSKFYFYLQTVVVFSPILISILITLIISKGILLNINRNEEYDLYTIGFLLSLLVVITLFFPYLISFGIKKYRNGNALFLKYFRKGIAVFGILNLAFALFKVLTDEDPNNFTFASLFKVLVEYYDSILG